MDEIRRFARLRRGAEDAAPGTSVVPENGMCLSSYLVIRPPSEDRQVLLGRIDPSAPWDRIGALDPSRIARVGGSWMLPSSQLLLFESPQEAALRIAQEQLASELPPIEAADFFSETYPSAGHPEGDPHWDFHFIFRARWPSTTPPSAPAWKELAFVEVDRLHREQIARLQGDVLELVGLAPARQ